MLMQMQASCRAAWVVHEAFAASLGRIAEELQWATTDSTRCFSLIEVREDHRAWGDGSIIVVGGLAAKPPVNKWMGSVSLADAAMTDNSAEYKILLFGLRKAQAYNLNWLHV
uniref:Polyketide synthase n=1 Tax=Peronospora matthiolae TaxID=2874970 RepID=A0AAV1TEU0_9STRA